MSSRPAAGGGRAIKLWDPVTGLERFTLQNFGPVTSVAFGPGGRALAAGGNGMVRVWRADD